VQTEAALTWLHLNGFISFDDEARTLSGTDLGKAAAFAGMTPAMALGVQAGGCVDGSCSSCRGDTLKGARHAGMQAHLPTRPAAVGLHPPVDLERARTWGLVTGTNLHVIFLVTPMWDLGRIRPLWSK
jgi:hypothetical protein